MDRHASGPGAEHAPVGRQPERRRRKRRRRTRWERFRHGIAGLFWFGSAVAEAPVDKAATAGERQRGRRTRCPFCGSTDTEGPIKRSDHILLLSTIIPRLRLRRCRSCTRHFLAFRPRKR